MLARERSGRRKRHEAEPFLKRGGGSRLLVLQVSSSKPASRSRIRDSIVAVGRFADWGVVLYDGSATDMWAAVARTARQLPCSFAVRTGTRPSDAQEISGRKFWPKLLFWLQAVDWMSTREYVCLADEDISFRRFDMDSYWQRMHGAFTRGPPLISQPLIDAIATDGYGDPRGKWAELLNSAELWQGSGVAAAETSYVEQQVAVVDTRFFLEHRKTWEQLAAMQHEVGSDFGLDTTWCGAAALYEPRRPACALVMVAVEHDDTRALNWTRDPAFVKRSVELERRVYKSVARPWWLRAQLLRRQLARRELSLFEASNRTCLAPTAAHQQERRHSHRVAVDARPAAMRPATILPCKITSLGAFPRVYAHLGELTMVGSSRDPQRAVSIALTPNQTATLEQMPRALERNPKRCCVDKGLWKCCTSSF